MRPLCRRATHVAQAHAGAGPRAPAGRAQFARRLIVEQHRLAAPHVVRRVGQHEGQQLFAQRLAQRGLQRCAADEISRLVEFDRQREPGLERCFVRPQLGAPGTAARFDAQGIQRKVAGVAQAQAGTGVAQHGVNVAGHFHRHVQLEARPTHIADAGRAHAGQAQVDLLRVGKRQAGGRQVVGADAGQQLTRTRAHQRQHAGQRADVGQRGVLVLADVAFDPVGIAHGLRRAGDDEKALGRQAQHGEITLEAAPRIEHGGVDHPPRRHVHLIGAQALQHGQRVAALQQQFAEGCLVVQRHRLSGGALLVDHPAQPTWAAQGVGRRGRVGRTKVVGALPAVFAAELGTARGQPVIQGRGAQRPGALQLLPRPAHGVVQAQGFGGALGQRLAVAGEGAEAADVDFPQVTRRLTAHHPLRDQLPGAA